MRVKPRTKLVITLSSFIISSVLALTIFGFYAYLGWKEKNIRRNYRLALYELNGQLFRKYLMVNLQAKIGAERTFKNKPIILGTIKNISNKKIYSLKVKITFYDSKHQVIYTDEFCPIGVEFEPFVNISDLTDETKNFLFEGDSVSFKHQLRNCPPKLMMYLKSKLKFAKTAYAEPLELTYKIEGLDIK